MKKNKLIITSLCLLGSVSLLAACGNTTTTGFDTTRNISKYTREAGSGTRECFFEAIGYSDVAKEDNWESGVQVASSASNSQIMSDVANDEFGIGYCSLDGLEGNTSVKALTFDGVEASNETVVNGQYKLNRNFNYVIRDYTSSTDAQAQSKSDVVHAFIEYFTSVEGVAVIGANGGILTSSGASTTLVDIIAKYPVLSGSETIEIKTCGSTSVQKVVQALIDKFVGDIPNKNIEILMNQTGSGDAVIGVTEGKNGVLSDIGFLSREIKSNELSALNDNNLRDVLCKDAVVCIVNAKNTVYTNTTAEELTAIYKGEITTWSELVK